MSTPKRTAREPDTSDAKPLTPEDRSLAMADKPITGVPCMLADGREWTLARMGNAEGGGRIRNALCEAAFYRRSVPHLLIAEAVTHALKWNYEISINEAWSLAIADGYDVMSPAANGETPFDAILGAWLPTHEACDFEYEDWLRSSLIINGIDPASVQSDDLPAVLAHLRAADRIIGCEQFIEAMVQGAKMQAARAQARAQAQSEPETVEV